MMRSRLRFLLLLLFAAVFAFSCASNADEVTEEDTPLVEAASEESPVTEQTAAESQQPEESAPLPDADDAAIAEPDVTDEELADVLPEEIVAASEADSSAVSLFDEIAALSDKHVENEFVPVEEEPVYTVDVTSYYDSFVVAEDEFVAVELPEPEPVIAPEPEPAPAIAVLTEEPEIVPETEVDMEETAPVMEPLYVPAPREDMKKPVSVITEEQAASAVEQEKEGTESVVEEILAAIPEPEEPAKPVPSRSITVRINDIIEAPYQGNWWVYLGDENGSSAITFSGREYVSEKTVFTLRAKNEGVALLHFFKQDIIANVMVDDYLEVVVEEAEGYSEKTTLDLFVISQIKPEPVPEATEEAGEGEAVEEAIPVPVSKGLVIEDEAPVITYVSEVENAAMFVEPAVTVTESVPEPAAEPVVMTDEEMFRAAQELESTDIEGALELYKKLTATYPTSPYWTKASNRITYINRFYFFKR